jgi:cyanophycinase
MSDAAAASASAGVLALVGGGEWSEGCTFDAELLDEARERLVSVLPTAAAYESPDRVIRQAEEYFGALDAEVVAVGALDRTAALDEELAQVVARSGFVYLASGSAMHLLSVLKRTPLWDAVQAAYHRGAVVAAAGASASVLCDAMVDPRGGGFGVGLGLVTELTLIPRYDRWSAEKSKRTIELAPAGLALAGIPDRTALIRDRDGSWRVSGVGEVRLFKDRAPAGLEVLQA